MDGQMMREPLLISSLLRHAERHHGEQQVASRDDAALQLLTYRDLASRSRRMAQALDALEVQAGARVATLAWNGHRHLELYYAVSGSGAVLHTLNPRLHPDQLVYIINHAADQVLFFEAGFLPLVETLAARLQNVQTFVLMTDRAHMPAATSIRGLACYEELLDSRDGDYAWPRLDENAAASLCYTSGTTGDPKGVLYSHRSTLLHTYAGALPDALNLSARDVVLPAVPMFHVNAWGLPYIACMTGAKLVLPGPRLDGAALYELIEGEGVTVLAGVPTLWLGLLAHLQASGGKFSSLKRTVIGGSAVPPAMMQEIHDRHGVEVVHAWGMTELSPLGTVCSLKRRHLQMDPAERRLLQAKQGRAIHGMDMKIVDDEGRDLPWDGRATGELMVRGHWVVERYLSGANSALVDDWFPTGDVASIDAEGYMQITDRRKDVIKSGGEWIGSIDLENIAMAHPKVAMAACIAMRHPKWGERPLLIVVKKPDAELSREEILGYYTGRVARWWTPDEVIFTDSLPIGATGKVLKAALRERFGHHRPPVVP